MAFPVDILTTVDHESLEVAAKNYMSQLLYRNPDTTEYLSLPDSKQIQIGLCNVSFVPLYGVDTKEKVLGLFSPDKGLVAGLYLLGRWWTVEDILKTADLSRTGLIKVSTLGERVVLYVLNRFVYRAKEKSSEDIPFLCHCEHETAKILWKDGEAIGFYSVKPKGSLCSNFLTQRYQLPVMDTIFVRKCHRGNGHGLQILEDFVGSFRKEYLGLKFPLSKAMYKVCAKYFSMYPGDKKLLWEVEGIGGPFQRTLIASKLQKLKLKEKDDVVSKLNFEEDNISAPVEIEVTKIQETTEYTMEIVEDTITKVTKVVDDIPVTRRGRSSNLKRRGIRENSEERLSKNIIRVEDIEAGAESPIEVVTEEKLGNSTFNVKESESEAVLKSTTVSVTAAVTKISELRDSQKEEEEQEIETVEDIFVRPAIDLVKGISEKGLENKEETPVTHLTTVGEIKSRGGSEEVHEMINKEHTMEIQGATIGSFDQCHPQSVVDLEIIKISTGIEEEQKEKLENIKEGEEDEPVCEVEEEIKQMLDEPEKTKENANSKESEKIQEIVDIVSDIEKIVEEEEMHTEETENKNIDKADIIPEELTAENIILEQTEAAKPTEKEQTHRDVEKREEIEKTEEDEVLEESVKDLSEETEENQDDNMGSEACEAKDIDKVLQQSLEDKHQKELVAEEESVKKTHFTEEVPCDKPKHSETEQVFSNIKSAQKRISVITPSRRSKRLRHQPAHTERDLKSTAKYFKTTQYSKAMMQEEHTKETMDEPVDNDSEVKEETQGPQVEVEECKGNDKLKVSTVEADITDVKETANADPEVSEVVKGAEIESQREAPQQSTLEPAEVQEEKMAPEEDLKKEGNGTMMSTLRKAKVVLLDLNMPSPKEAGESHTIKETLHTQEEKESDKGALGITEEDGKKQTVSQLKTSEHQAAEEIVRLEEQEGTLDKPMEETARTTIKEGYELADNANRIPGQSNADKMQGGEPKPETTEVFHPSQAEKQEEKTDTEQEDEQDSGKDSDEAAQQRRPANTPRRSRRLRDQPIDPGVTVRSFRSTIKAAETSPLRRSTQSKAVIQQVETFKLQVEKREEAELGNYENTVSDAEDAGPEEPEKTNTNVEETTAVDPVSCELMKGAEIDDIDKAQQIVDSTEEAQLLETEHDEDVEKEEDSTPVIKQQNATVMLVDVNKLSQKLKVNSETALAVELPVDKSANIEPEQYSMESEQDKQLKEVDTKEATEKTPEEEKMEEENTVNEQNEPDKQDMTFKEQKPAEEGVLEKKMTEDLEEGQNDIKETEIIDEYKAVIYEAVEEAITSGEHPDTMEDLSNKVQETENYQDNALKEKQIDSDKAGEKIEKNMATMSAEERNKNENIQNEDEEMEEEAPVYTERILRQRTVTVQSPPRRKSKRLQKQDSGADVEIQESHTVRSKDDTETEKGDEEIDKLMENQEADLTETMRTVEEKEEAPKMGWEEANLVQREYEPFVENETSETDRPTEMDEATMVGKERFIRRSLRLSAKPVISSPRRTSQCLHTQKLEPVEEADMSGKEHDKISATTEETVNISMPIITIETNLKILDEIANTNVEETTAFDPESSELLKGVKMYDEEKVPRIVEVTEKEIPLVDTAPDKDVEKEDDTTPVIKMQNITVKLVDVNKLFQKTEGNSKTPEELVLSQREEELELDNSANSEHEQSNMESEVDKQQEVLEMEQDTEKMPEEGVVLETKTTENLEEGQNDVNEIVDEYKAVLDEDPDAMEDRPNIIQEIDNNQDNVLKEKQNDSNIAGEMIEDKKAIMPAEDIVVESTKNVNIRNEDEERSSLAQDKDVQEKESPVHTERSLRRRTVRVQSPPRRSKRVQKQESKEDVETQESHTVGSTDKTDTVPIPEKGVEEKDQEKDKMDNKKIHLTETKETDEEDAAPEMRREEANLEQQENKPSKTSETKTNIIENENLVELVAEEGVQDKDKVQENTNLNTEQKDNIQDKEEDQIRTSSMEKDSTNQKAVSQEENLEETNQNETPAALEKAALESSDEEAPLITRKSLRCRTVTVESTPRRKSKRHYRQELEPEKEAMNDRCGNEKNSAMEEAADNLNVNTEKENEPLNAEFENMEAKMGEDAIQVNTDEKAGTHNKVEEEGNEILVERMKHNCVIQEEAQGEPHEDLGNTQKDTELNNAQEESLDREDLQKPKEQEDVSSVQEEEIHFQGSSSVTEGMQGISSELEETVVEKRILRKRRTTVAATAPRKSKYLCKQEQDEGSEHVEEPANRQIEYADSEWIVSKDVELKSDVQTAMVFEEKVEESNLGEETPQQMSKDGTKSDGNHNNHEDGSTETGVGESVEGQKDETEVKEQNNKKVEETDKTNEKEVIEHEEKEEQNLESSLNVGFTLELEEEEKSDQEGNIADKQSQVVTEVPKEISTSEEKSEKSEEHISDDDENGLVMEKHVPQRTSSATALTTRRSVRLQFHENKKNNKEDEVQQATEQRPQRKRKAIADATPAHRSKRHERGNIA
ncbi:trichohyalin-like [Myxocyprinus asiaticus]|uniref:trichohyalin-like n=1 Tax=Myxocyprinus asiaticus TaxID=70543 RepID=UPI002222D59A|nr:trichohyalin-like [Myxocyprinus asiaticus]XP_051522115.1 trichohyalin-like [Myxocyprinus asiaticus]